MLGQGGMGTVYLARDMGELERTVALKFLTAEIASDSSRMQRFIQEARTVSTLNHPNILTIYEFGQADDTRFIATEFIDGTTLREHMLDGRVKLHDVLEIAAQIAAALDAAHEAGVVHRDIKPENIMIRRRDHIVKVLDFGLAKPPVRPETAATGAADETVTQMRLLTEPGTIMGTVAYMSPEQSSGAAVDARTDIWSLGVVLYEMLAGCVPFQGKDAHRQIIAIQEQEPPHLSRFTAGVPERLQEIIRKALAKDPGERYQTVKDLLIDLRSLRRKLEVEAEVERISGADSPPSKTGDGEEATISAASGAAVDIVSGARSPGPSSTESLFDRFRSHKRWILAGVVVLLLAAVVVYRSYTGTASNRARIESIAVLPFENMSRNVELEYLSDGMTESLINSLAELSHLSVKARSSVIRYKGKDVEPRQVASELSVQALLTGRLMQRNEDLVLYLSLVDALNGNQLWGEQYDRKLTDLVSLQREIARNVSDQLRPRLTEPQKKQLSSGTDDAAAYQAYLKGRYYWNKGIGSGSDSGFDRSREFFQRAIDIDPSYALAYAGLSDYYGVSAAYGAVGGNEIWLRSEAAAKKALALNAELGEAYNGLAGVEMNYYRDWPAAERAFRRGIALVPNFAVIRHHYAQCLITAGRSEEAIVEFRRALELEPFELRFNVNFGRLFIYMRQPDRAIDQLHKTLEIDPDYAAAHEWLGYAYEYKGMHDEAIAQWSRALNLTGEAEQAAILERAYEASGFEAAVSALAQRKLEALKKKSDAGGYVPAVHFVTAYMRIGDKVQAFAWLEKAVEERNRFALEFKLSPIFDRLRTDPRFEVLVARTAVRMR